jgi:hypothetical protein
MAGPVKVTLPALQWPVKGGAVQVSKLRLKQ